MGETVSLKAAVRQADGVVSTMVESITALSEDVAAAKAVASGQRDDRPPHAPPSGAHTSRRAGTGWWASMR